MKRWQFFWLVSALVAPCAPGLAEDTVYKSVDESGHVTYSQTPPAGAARVEDVPLLPGPSDEVARESMERAKEMQQEADARYDALMEQRRQDAEAREKAQAAAEAAAERRREQAYQESLEESMWGWGVPYYAGPYRPNWHRPNPPNPPHPPHPPLPPRPPLQGNP